MASGYIRRGATITMPPKRHAPKLTKPTSSSGAPVPVPPTPVTTAPPPTTGSMSVTNLQALQRTAGNRATTALLSNVVQRNPTAPVTIDVKSSKWTDEKDTGIIGGTKRSSMFSRREAETKLAQTVDQAAKSLVDALTKGLSGLKAFERVAFAIAGHDGIAVKKAYQLSSGGRILTSDIYSVFSADPGPKAAEYLVDCLRNGGKPSLEAKLYIAMGLVDSSAAVIKTLNKIPKLGDKIPWASDEERIEELIERAPSAERQKVFANTEIMDALSDRDPKMLERLFALQQVDIETENVEAKGTGATALDKQRLAGAKDRQLALMVTQLTKGLPLSSTINKKVEKVSSKVGSKLGTKTLHSEKMSWQNIKFDSKKFYDFLLDWRSTATEEDLKAIRLPNSAFQTAFKMVPSNALTGLTKSEVGFISNLLGSNVTGAEGVQVEMVKQSITRQKEFVDRPDGKGWLSSRLPRYIAGKKWRDLGAEIKLLSETQRKKILDDYDPNPQTAITKLEADLLAAGLDKEERAELKSMFNTEFGKAGGNYSDLWVLMEPGRGSRISEQLGHLKPTKWKKMGEARSGKSLGKSALKIVMELEDNEFALVRQDKALLAKIHEHSTDKVWESILAALGMKNEQDQLPTDDTRVMVHQAKVAAEVNPTRWAMQLDDAIEEDTVGSGVSAGRDKAQLYVVATKAQAAARLGQKNDENFDPQAFLDKVLQLLAQSNPKKLAYLQKRVPDVHAAFAQNKPIPASVRIARAKHEGFGVGEKRKADRQKLYWAFSSLSGKELIDDWSNLDEFKGLNEGSKDAEKKISAATDVIANGAGNNSPENVKKVDTANRDLNTYTDLLGQIHSQMQTFTLGIKEARRADFKSLGLTAEDRVSLEAMVTDKLADAMDDDHEVQAILDEANLPYDKYMRAKMKGIDALEMQRLLDTTRQWHQFSTKGSQLSEATRNVKGSAVSTETKLSEAKKTGKTRDEIDEIRKTGGKETEEAVQERGELEARFRDMQETLKRRAMLIFKLIVTAIVTAIVAAATFGAGAPLGIGLHIGLEAGFTVLQALFSYYVLGEKDLAKLAIEAGMNILNATVRIMTANLAIAANASFMNPADWGPGADWIAQPLAKGLGKIINDTVMFAPKHIVKQVMQEKPLEKVVKDGEDTIADSATSQLKKSAKGFFSKIAVAGLKETKLQTEGAISGEGVTKVHPTRKDFGTSMTDRLSGGSTQHTTLQTEGTVSDEQQGMWGKYQKQKIRETKKQAMEAYKGTDERGKGAQEDRRKDELKEARKEKKAGLYKQVADTIDSKLKEYRKLRGEKLLEQFTTDNIPVVALRQLDNDQLGSLEGSLHMNPGQLNKELVMPGHVELLLMALQGHIGNFQKGTLKNLVENGTINMGLFLQLKVWERNQLAWALGLDPDDMWREVNAAHLKRRIRSSKPPDRAPPEPPGSKPPNRPPPPSPGLKPRSSRPPNRPPPPSPTTKPKLGT